MSPRTLTTPQAPLPRRKSAGPMLMGLAALIAATSAGIARAEPLLIECESLPAGGWALLIETDVGGRPTAIARPDGSIQVSIADPDPDGWQLAERTCRRVARTSVVPGSLLGERASQVIVTPLKGFSAPRIVEAVGRVRLLWIPTAPPTPSEPAAAAPAAAASGRPSAAAQKPAAPSPAVEAPPATSASEPSQPAQRQESQSGAPVAAKKPAAVTPAPAAASQPLPAPRVPAVALPALAIARLSPPETLAASLATEARRGPGRREDIIRRVAVGEIVTADGRSGDWLRLVGGEWVFGPYFAPSGSAPEFMATVSADKAQVRSGPGAQHDLVAEIFKGEAVAIDDVRGDWAHVRNGGWVPLGSIAK